MTRWFRFYDDAMNDPKVQRLPGEKFKAWINLLCLASKNGGVLPALDDIAFALRVTRDEITLTLDEFCANGLLDPVEVRDAPMSYEPHNWGERQYISDSKDPTSAERSKRYRDRKRVAQCRDRDATVTVTATRTDTDTEQKDSCAIAKATRKIEYSKEFEEAWQEYPRRDGGNPKALAAKLFFAAVKAGADPQAIIDGAKRFAIAESKNIGTPYIPQMVKWLRDKRWLDYTGEAAVVKFDARRFMS